MNQATQAIFKEQQNSNPTFHVVLKGVRPNVPPSEARTKLATLFKGTLEQIDHLLALPSYVVKKDCTLDVATKYKKAIEAAGGACELVPVEAPTISLDVDLPPSALPAAEAKKAESQPRPATGIPVADMPPSKDALTDKWKKIFILFEKAGGPKLPKGKELSFRERMKVVFNGWGFFFGPFYYLAKGMWKKAIVLFALCLVAIVVLEMILDAVGLSNSKLTSFIAPAVFGTRANIDYYKKIVLGDNGWW